MQALSLNHDYLYSERNGVNNQLEGICMQNRDDKFN